MCLEVSSAEMAVRADRVSAYAGDSVSLSTAGRGCECWRAVSAFAGESASLVSGRVSVSAAESLHVSTGATGSLGFQTGRCWWRLDGTLSVASSSDVSVGGRTVRVSSAEDVGVTSGADLRLSSGWRDRGSCLALVLSVAWARAWTLLPVV